MYTNEYIDNVRMIDKKEGKGEVWGRWWMRIMEWVIEDILSLRPGV